jgi:hypothetical protein
VKIDSENFVIEKGLCQSKDKPKSADWGHPLTLIIGHYGKDVDISEVK